MPEPRTDLSTAELPEEPERRASQGYGAVTLTDEQRTKLQGWLHDHYTQIMTEMRPVLQRFEAERNQFDGVLVGGDYPYAGAFRVNYPVTKRKVREIVDRAKQAYLDSDPIWTLTTDDPRLMALTEKLELALDRLVDHHLQADTALSQWVFEAGLHGVGCLAPGWLYHEDQRHDVETYKGFDGKDVATLQDLVTFEQRYPDWRQEKESRDLHSAIANGQDISKEVTYTQATHNRPELRWVPISTVRVYPTVDGWAGLRTTPAYGYVVSYTRAELEQFVASELLEPEDLARLLQTPTGTDRDRPQPVDEVERFDIWHATIRYTLKDNEEPQRLSVWFAVDEQILLRTRTYPWWNPEPDLVPLYIRQEHQGFFKPGLAFDVRDDHVVLNTMLNLFLNATDLANSMKFKAKKGSLAEQHLLLRRFSPHLPLPWKDNPNEVEPMQVSAHPLNYLVQGFQLMKQQADEQTSTSSLQTGRESPTDPTAPATKTALLLQQVEPAMKEYFRSMEPGFRQVGQWILWLYYQGYRLGWIDAIPGIEPQMAEQLPSIIETLTPRALLFEFDRPGRTERNIAVTKMIAEVAPGSPAIFQAVQHTIEQMDSQWARLAPTLQWMAPQPTAAPGGAPGPSPGGQMAPPISPAAGNGHGAPPGSTLQSQLQALVPQQLAR